MANINPSPYRYSFFQTALQAVQGFGRLAHQRGLGAEFAHDLRTWTDRLKTDPVGWGDPLYDFHNLGMTYYRGSSDFLFAYFCVNQAARQVIVQSVVAGPYSALA